MPSLYMIFSPCADDMFMIETYTDQPNNGYYLDKSNDVCMEDCITNN